ncbi:MAG: hypothetical protein M0Z93_00735 [Actinomycetota bacterium]|nr:hypothetical protein [Actinomycetota bacterium]
MNDVTDKGRPTGNHQDVEAVADRIADLVSVDSERIAIEPSADRIGLTVPQSRRLLAKIEGERPPKRDLKTGMHDDLVRTQQTKW